jgi:putative peptidoglycan lipid II flippase
MTKTIQRTAIHAVLIMLVANLLSRVIGLVRTVVLAGVVGTTGEGDAFTFAFLLPDILNQLLAGSVLSVTFIPIFQGFVKGKADDEKWEFFSTLFFWGTLLFLIAISVIEVVAPSLLWKFAGENITNSPELFATTVKMTRIILPAQLFFFWGALFNGIQYSEKKFFLPSLTPLVYNIFIILGGVLLAPIVGIEGFAWGVLAGAFLGNVGIQYFGARRSGMEFRAHISPKNQHLIEWFYKTVPLVLGLGLTFSNEFMFRFFASRNGDGEGAIVALNYAYRLVMVMVGLFGQAFAAGIYPFLSKLANENRKDRMEELLISALTKTAALAITAAIIVYFVRFEIIAILFERKAFTAESTALTARAFASYLPGVFFFAAILMVNRLFFAVKKTTIPLITSTISLLITLPLYPILGDKFGVSGIALASSSYSILSFILLVFSWKRYYPQSKLLSLFPRLIKISLIAVAGGLVATLLSKLSLPQFEISTVDRIIRVLVIAGFPFGLCIVGLDRVGILSIRSIVKKIIGK